jgi:hypothetical protein
LLFLHQGHWVGWRFCVGNWAVCSVRSRKKRRRGLI